MYDHRTTPATHTRKHTQNWSEDSQQYHPWIVHRHNFYLQLLLSSKESEPHRRKKKLSCRNEITTFACDKLHACVISSREKNTRDLPGLAHPVPFCRAHPSIWGAEGALGSKENHRGPSTPQPSCIFLPVTFGDSTKWGSLHSGDVSERAASTLSTLSDQHMSFECRCRSTGPEKAEGTIVGCLLFYTLELST